MEGSPTPRHHDVRFFWTSDQALVRLCQVDGQAAGGWEALFDPGEWKPVKEVGDLMQLSEVQAVEHAHSLIGRAVDLFEGLPAEYGKGDPRLAPERVNRLRAELRAEWEAAGRVHEVDEPTWGSHHEFWTELMRRLREPA